MQCIRSTTYWISFPSLRIDGSAKKPHSDRPTTIISQSPLYFYDHSEEFPYQEVMSAPLLKAGKEYYQGKLDNVGRFLSRKSNRVEKEYTTPNIKPFSWGLSRVERLIHSFITSYLMELTLLEHLLKLKSTMLLSKIHRLNFAMMDNSNKAQMIYWDSYHMEQDHRRLASTNLMGFTILENELKDVWYGLAVTSSVSTKEISTNKAVFQDMVSFWLLRNPSGTNGKV